MPTLSWVGLFPAHHSISNFPQETIVLRTLILTGPATQLNSFNFNSGTPRMSLRYVWSICSHFWWVKHLQTFSSHSQHPYKTTIQYSANSKPSGHSPSVPNSQAHGFIVKVGTHSILGQRSIHWCTINECPFWDRINETVFSWQLPPKKMSYSCYWFLWMDDIREKKTAALYPANIK